MSKHVSQSNRGITSNVVFTVLIIVAVISAAAALIFNLTYGDNSSKNAQVGIELPMVQLDGTWAADENGTRFLATVKDEKISIDMGDDASTMLYWYGTFKHVESPGADITSTKLKTDKLVLSGADAKDFTVENDTITFEFEAMGAKKKVVMTRG